MSAVAKNLEDLVDGGFDLKIKPNAIGASGSIIPIADVSGKNLHDLFDGGYDVPIKPQYVHHKFLSKSTSYTATASDTIIEVNATTGNATINLPTAVGIESKTYIIIKIDATVNTVTIDPNGSQTINGDTTRVLNYQYEALIIHSDNANWKEHVPSKAMIAVQTTPSAVPIRDITRGLVIINNSGNPNIQVDIDADEVNLQDAAGAFFKATSVNLTADITAAGVNGLDTGARATDTWYYIWVIYNNTTTTTASLLSTQSAIGSLTLPSGYTFGARVGSIRTNATGSGNFERIRKEGARAQYTTMTTNQRAAYATANVGDPAVPTWVAVAVRGATTQAVPPTAKRIIGYVRGQEGAAGTEYIIAAPNNSYGSRSSTTNPPPVAMKPLNDVRHQSFDWLLESNNIYWAYEHSNAHAGIWVLGWEE